MTAGGGGYPANADSEHALFEHVRKEFGIGLVSKSKVHRGEDVGAVVLRGFAQDGASFAVKLSSRAPERGFLVSSHLAALGMRGIPTPLLARSGKPWSDFDGRQVSMTPWVRSRPAGGGMTPDQWRNFGALLAAVHAVDLPRSLQGELKHEDYRIPEASQVRALDTWVRGGEADHTQIGGADREDALSRALIGDWLAASDSIAVLLDRAQTLGQLLRSHRPQNVLCHGDSHVDNLLVDADEQVWLVDWDAVVFAPRERDLKFVLEGPTTTAPARPGHEVSFLNGYGPVDVDPVRLAYFRCAWALEDLGLFGADIVGERDRAHQERAHALDLFRGLLSPMGIVELALRSVRELG